MGSISPKSPRFNNPSNSAFPTEKICARCGKKQPIEAFEVVDVYKLDNLSGYSLKCLNCLFKENTAPKSQPTRSTSCLVEDEYDQIRKCTSRANRLYADFSITWEQYEAMLKKQNGVCAVCGQKETSTTRHGKVKQLAVDHDHETGKVRALLCTGCNSALGFLKEDPARIRALAKYIEKHKP